MTETAHRVLLVDDDPDDRFLISRRLGDRCQIIEAGGIVDARSCMTEGLPAAAIVDQSLPDGRGLDFVSELWEAGVPSIVVSGGGDERLAADSILRGASDYIPKADLGHLDIGSRVDRVVAVHREHRELERLRDDMKLIGGYASHDMRGPLLTISVFADRLLSDIGPQDPEVSHRLERIRAAATTAHAMTDRVLRLARTGRAPVTVRPCRLHSVVETVRLQLAADIAGARANLVLTSDCMLAGDPIDLVRLVQNLVENALFNASGPGWSRSGTMEDRKVGITIEVSGSVSESSGDALIDVVDNGPPRTECSDHRAGFALSMCRNIVMSHGGRLSDEVVSGDQHRVRVVLPPIESGEISAPA
ncbi:MAG: response regulator [Phycisphaerales bacterium]